MVVENGHPAKKRRLDNTTQIDETNATLQHFTGARCNRWMHRDVPAAASEATNRGHQTPAARTHAAATATGTTAGRSNARPEVAAAMRNTRNEAVLSMWETIPGQRQERSLSAQQNPQATTIKANIVSYEAPPQTTASPNMVAMQSSSSTAPAVTSRKSVDLTSAAGPGLPSPAPSDENSNSPILTGVQYVQRRPRSGVPNRTSSVPYAAPFQPPPPSAPPMPMQQHALPPRQPGGQQIAYGPPEGPSVASNMLSAQQSQHSHPRPGVPHRRSMPSNFQTFPAPATAGQSPIIQQSPVLPSIDARSRPPIAFMASRISPNVLLQRIDMKTLELRQAGSLSGTDAGRLALLREAVEKGDWFYQVLSQLCCLRSVSPALLPRSIRDLPDECYGFVDGLLCPNTHINQGLLTFFAEFPEPIMDIYSDQSQGVREVFESRVNTVKVFLSRLPSFWEGIVNKCKQMRGPPLVQDLVDILNMKSVVLQTTTFRAVARMFYGLRESDARGINAVEIVHRIDQDTFLRQFYRRTDAEKTEAYHMLRRVFEKWTVHIQQQQSSRNNPPDFRPPQEVVDYFQRLPDSMMQQQMLQLQHQAQNNMLANPGQMHQLQQRLTQAQGPGMAGPSPTNVQFPPNAILRPPSGPSQAMFQMGRPNAQHPRAPQVRQLYHPAHEPPRPQPTHPDTMRSAAHQAHLRSPLMKPLEDEVDCSQLYRHVVGFALPPTRLRKDLSQTIKFNVSQVLVDRIPKTDSTPAIAGEPRRRAVGDKSLMYRLRCSALPRGGLATESAWVTADNYWPDEFAYDVNGTKLELRRKLHHGRYLPVDLTDLIKAGENTLKVFRNIRFNDKRQLGQYAIGIEVIGVIGHATILAKTSRVSEEVSLTAIKKSLTGDDAGDDDFAVISSALTIGLFDPYSGCKIFDIPVRGVNCLHRDCFDLETFLSQCKRQQPGWPVVDCWRCPLCRGDVRPQTLVIDEFLVRVREQLALQGKLDTRSITVEADGSWKAKEEESSGVRSPSLEREEQLANSRMPVPMPAAPKKVVEIIELD